MNESIIETITHILGNSTKYRIKDFCWEDLGDHMEIRFSYEELPKSYEAIHNPNTEKYFFPQSDQE